MCGCLPSFQRRLCIVNHSTSNFFFYINRDDGTHASEGSLSPKLRFCKEFRGCEAKDDYYIEAFVLDSIGHIVHHHKRFVPASSGKTTVVISNTDFAHS